ncbi:MAG: CDP-diacylglycerol--glycerol-3-phosphate 3-phosphatidyltransferase [Candidatus Howiella sp.]
MNLPNKLTVLRILLAPVFLALLTIRFPGHFLLALLVFIAASLTDLADGKIARSRGLVTDFGKFLDPLADKMLTTAAFLGFIWLDFGCGVVWITMIVLTREFLITSLRLTAAGSGRVIAANIWGKAKTVCQMTAIITTLVYYVAGDLSATPGILPDILYVLSAVLLWLSAGMTLLSGAIYLRDNAGFINTNR